MEIWLIHSAISKSFSISDIKVGLLVRVPSETFRGETTKSEKTEDTMESNQELTEGCWSSDDTCPRHVRRLLKS